MNKKERLLATVAGQQTDHIPSGFWLHFPCACHHGESAINTHLDFFEKTNVDLCKIMNENLLKGNRPINTPKDYLNLTFGEDCKKSIDTQVEQIKRVMDKTDGSALYQATIHGVVVSTHHASLREGFYVDNIDFFRTCMDREPAALLGAMRAVTDQLCELARRCVDVGADGIYYAALGGERHLFTAQEYAELILPLEQEVFRAAGAGCHTLHICKHGLDISRFAPLPAQIVNWAIHEDNPSLEEGFQIFSGKTILGGLDDRAGVLVDGGPDQIAAEVGDLIKRAAGRPFILGADCTLPTDISYERIRTAVEACKTTK